MRILFNKQMISNTDTRNVGLKIFERHFESLQSNGN